MHLSANVKTNLKNAAVESIMFIKNTNTFAVELSSPNIIDEECIEHFKADIKDNFEFVNSVELRVKYAMDNMPAEKRIELYWNNLLKSIQSRSVYAYMALLNSERYIENGTCVIKLKSNSACFLNRMRIDSYIAEMFEKRLGLGLKVELQNGAPPELDENRLIMTYTKEEMEAYAEEAREKFRQEAEAAGRPVPETRPEKGLFRKKSAMSNASTDEITEEATPIKLLGEEEKEYVVNGKVLFPETKETRSGKLLVKFIIADKESAITAKFFSKPETFESDFDGFLKDGELKSGIYVKVKGKYKIDDFEKGEPVIMVNRFNKGEPPYVRPDNAPEKRVELHLHTQMSMMDAVTSATDYINRAAYWGHRAIAITDHGVVQAYPEAKIAAKKAGVKVLYGVEGYLVDDMSAVAKNIIDYPCSGRVVVFDLETTGLSANKDKIIEIGAVKVENGRIIDRFSSFVNPHQPLEPKIVKLTGIDDEILADAPDDTKVLPDFLEFIKDSVLVAHNAPFDTGFVRNWCRKHGENFDYGFVDTVELSKVLLPDMEHYKLDLVCDELGVELQNHHRAVDDAEATAGLFLKELEILAKDGVTTLKQVNEYAQKHINPRMIPKYYHIIILVQNMKGLRNLYELISDTHIKYFNRRPKLPKSRLIEMREGLILGSACEAGDLFNYVFDGYDEEIIKQTVDFYDYLEIQPIGNNRFMIGNQSRSGKSVENEEELRELNRKIVALGEKYNKPVAATCDAHFLDPGDEIFRRIVQTGEGFDDVDNQPPLFYRNTEEMLEEFAYLGEEKAYEVVVTNTNLIADWIGDVNPVYEGTCPPKMPNADEDLRRITHERAKEIYGDPLPEIVETRLNKELDSIITHGFAVLYIIAQKLVWNSMENGYIVGSRGSVGSSFAATMAGITEVNPLDPHYICPNCKYSDFTSEEVIANAGNSGFDLPDKDCPVCGHKLSKNGQAIPFETFLGFNGDKEPDIDLNFSGEYQQRAHRYCETLFGDGHVFKAGTISCLQDKTVFGYVAKYCESHNIHMTNAQKARLVDGCLGVKRTTGQHPGGLIIVPSDNTIYNFTAVQRPANEFESVVKTTHFDYHSIHDNLLKLDMLGHDVPTIIRMYHDITGFNPLDVPMDDKATISLFTSPEALGVTEEDIGCNTGSLGLPEFGTSFVRQMLMETKPNSFSDLVRISGLSHGTDVWTNNAQDLVRDGVATIKEIIPTRDDIMVYLIIKGVEKGKAFEIMEKVRKGKGLTPEHEELMRAHDVPEWYIESCKKIKYMFPKGHAVAYVTNTFRIGYFKINYPYAFYAAQFSVKYEDFDYNIMAFGRDRVLAKMKEIDEKGDEKTAKDKSMRTTLELVNEMYARGLKFVPMDLYKSDPFKFKVTEDGLMPPLCTIQGLGGTAAEGIAAAREERPFDNIEDFRKRTGLGKTLIQLLREAHLFDGMEESDQLSLFTMMK